MVWNEAPVWQRDHGAHLLKYPTDRARAFAQVERTVKAARSHPSVITHSTANELSFTPDRRPDPRVPAVAADTARDLDPTLPIAIDIKTRPGARGAVRLPGLRHHRDQPVLRLVSVGRRLHLL